MIRVMILIPIATLLISCGLFGDQIDYSRPHPLGERPTPIYAGDSLVETKIIRHQIIVRASMTSLSSEIATDPYGGYYVVLKFNLAVSEYLKGTGPPSIVAVWVDDTYHNKLVEAESRRQAILAARYMHHRRWDDREAVIFLSDTDTDEGFGTYLAWEVEAPDHYALGSSDRYDLRGDADIVGPIGGGFWGSLSLFDDRYSLSSRSHRNWLPAARTTSTGDNPEFLLALLPRLETITLLELKRKIADVTDELAVSGRSKHQECVQEKYRHIQNQRNWPEETGKPYDIWDLNYTLVSGSSAGTVLDQGERKGGYPDDKLPGAWLEGGDSALFSVEDGPPTTNGTRRFDRIVRLARPLPAGRYEFDLKEALRRFAVCKFVVSNEWTVTAIAPEGVVHEALFDPVTDGSAVAADSSNGVLEPVTFIDAGAATTIDRIEWEAGTVKVKYSSRTALAGRVLDFIELDGRASLSLVIDDATVDAANNTLNWSVSSQPWEDGDKLMLRIR